MYSRLHLFVRPHKLLWRSFSSCYNGGHQPRGVSMLKGHCENNIHLNIFKFLAASFFAVLFLLPTIASAGWTQRDATILGPHDWGSDIASSADGTKLAAYDFFGTDDGYIYTSADSGVTWTRQTAAGLRRWAAITSSSDGTKLAAAVSPGYIYTSTDSGVTWTERTGAGSLSRTDIVSSADGTKLVASRTGYLYTSADSGATWTEQTAAGSRTWRELTSSADGTNPAAAVSPGF